MQFERGKAPETTNAPYRAPRIKDERWRSAGPGFAPGTAAEFFASRAGSSRKQKEPSSDDTRYFWTSEVVNESNFISKCD
jgi:hypothetical protein